MKKSPTVVLFVVAAALFAFIYFHASRQLGTRQAAQSSQYAVVFDSDTLTGLAVASRDQTIRLAKADGQWRITSPVEDRADNLLISQILAALEHIPRLETILPSPDRGPNDLLKYYSLAKPKMRIDFEGPGAPPAILVGRETAVDGRIYFGVDGRSEVYVTETSLRDAINHPLDDFRDRRLMSIPLDDLTGVTLTTPAGEIELRRGDGGWRLVRPVSARADNETIQKLATSVAGARIDAFLPADAATLQETGLASPRGSIAFRLEGSDEPETVLIGNQVPPAPPADKPPSDPAVPAPTPEPGRVYARYSSRPTINKLPEAVAKILEFTPNDLRDRALARFETDVVDRLRIRPAGAGEILLVRGEDDWTLKGEPDSPANGSMAMDVLHLLLQARTESFVADTNSDPAAYGFDQPRLQVVVSSFASENVPDGGPGEHEIAAIQFGADVPGQPRVYACLKNEPFVVSVPKAVVDAIPPDPALWLSNRIFQFEPAEIAEFTLDAAGRSLHFRRTADGSWRRDGEHPIADPAMLESFASALASLKAVRRIGAAEAASAGLDQPAARISFRTGGKEWELVVGKPGGEDLWYAKAGGQAGAFILSRPDYEALRLPLTLKPEPSKPPPAAKAGE